MKRNQKFAFLTILLTFVLACNLPGTATQPAISVNDQAATIIAMTLQSQPQTGTAFTPTMTATLSPVSQSTSTLGPTVTITPTYSVPTLTLREQTNCRTGPGQEYQILFAYRKGVKLEIIGHYPPTNFWLVKAPESSTGICWVSGQYADLTGSYWVVPSVTPPATATLIPPKAPSITKWDFFCNTATSEMNITILWKDNAGNETGFNVYRDAQKVAELPADSHSYSETIIVQTGQNIKYQIEVFGPSGSALSSVISITC